MIFVKCEITEGSEKKANVFYGFHLVSNRPLKPKTKAGLEEEVLGCLKELKSDYSNDKYFPDGVSYTSERRTDFHFPETGRKSPHLLL